MTRRQQTPRLVLDPKVQPFYELAIKAAWRYCRRYRDVELDDLQQESWLAILPALETYDPALEGPGGREGYVWRAIVRWLAGYIQTIPRPVSGSRKALKKQGTFRTVSLVDLEGGPRAKDDGIADVTLPRAFVESLLDELREGCPEPERALDEGRWTSRAREVIDDALRDLGSRQERAEDLLRGELRAAEVAKAEGIRPQNLYRLRDQAFQRLASTPAVHEVWADRRRLG